MKKKKAKQFDADKFAIALASSVTQEIKDFALKGCEDAEFTCKPEEVVEINISVEQNKSADDLYKILKEEYYNLAKSIEEKKGE